jgi:hypothetical protein
LTLLPAAGEQLRHRRLIDAGQHGLGRLPVETGAGEGGELTLPIAAGSGRAVGP